MGGQEGPKVLAGLWGTLPYPALGRQWGLIGGGWAYTWCSTTAVAVEWVRLPRESF